jgi:hypothetical protein
MTTNQWRMLEILSNWGGLGTCEVECQWGGYEYGEGEAAEAKAWRVNRLVVAGIIRSLVTKGFATNTEGYDITEAGAEILRKRAIRLKAKC